MFTLQRLADKRSLDTAEADNLEEAIHRVRDLSDYPFRAVELASAVGEEQVAEIFVRINSEGVTLNQADFILTLMSVFWEKGRRELEAFSRGCRAPSLSLASPFNWYIQPSPAQLLRVSVALAFRRAVLKQVYTILRGKDVETGKSDPDRRDSQFAKLQAAQEKVLDLTNWHEFLRCLERAGYRGAKMISSDNTLLFSYALWLFGRTEFRVPLDRLCESIACWFFMAHMTGRYSGSFESQFERDVARLAAVARGDTEGYLRTLRRIIDDTLTADYWAITLPNDLATSASKSPALLAYIAALNILDADALLSTGKVRSRLDPALTVKKGIERHHLFPKAYLQRELGVADSKVANQIANMALVEWSDNIAISDDAPNSYWPTQLEEKNLPGVMLEKQMYWHALPEGWHNMDYQTFLIARRKLMAQVARDAFTKLSEHGYAPVYPRVAASSDVPAPGKRRVYHGVRVADLVDADLLSAGTTLLAVQHGVQAVATVLHDGRIAYEDEIYDTPTNAAWAVLQDTVNGWYFWAADTPDGRFTLAALRERFLAGRE